MPSDTVTKQAHQCTTSYRAAQRVRQIVARCLIVIAALCMVMMIPANPEPPPYINTLWPNVGGQTS